MVASELFSSLAAPVFAAMLFIFFLKRRSREINGGEANINAAATYGTAGGDSATHTSTEVPEVATSSGANKDDAAANDGTAGYDYEVFLSFRGPDTRSAFTDFLYTSLDGAGIRTFKDDDSLRVGEQFEPKLIQAINQSKISIPIFSKGYASSVWCLKELVQMVECQKTGRQKIMPIFYDVAPSEVRYQTEGYAEAFLAHKKKKRHEEKTIQEWKDALGVVGALNGWDLHSEEENRREGEFAKKLTDEIFRELKKAYLVVSDCLVSVHNHVDAIMKKIGDGTSETRIIGIHGMGGIGKTTIAKIIYNQLSDNFKHFCFLANIREMSERKGIEYLQHQLISGILKRKGMDITDIDEGTKTIKETLSNKRVLLILDDVDHKKHMDALVGKRNWFGTGSKLIITTRNKDVLEVPEVDEPYEVKIMDSDQSLQLFSKHAFRRDYPLDEYVNQSNRAIGICGGLPLALEVIGSLLSRIEKKKWDGKLKELENVPLEDVQSKLKISYNALRVREKHIFLDIACLFIRYDKDIVVHFWDKSKFFPDEAMEVLQNMSLIRIEKDNKVWMHDQLRDLGREIVRQESNMKIEKQSRVWDPKEGLDLLRKHKGKTEVEALRLKLDNQPQYRFTYEGFERLSYLRFLEVEDWTKNFCAEERLLWHESPSNVPPANENSDLLPQLRWLSWHHIPPTFNITNFSMEDVVILNLSGNEITYDWNGWSHMEVMKNLKVMDLSYCYCLERTPNFSTHSNLERLSLNCCNELVKIDESICQLKSLVSLDVGNCWNLRRLPDELGRDLASLKYLSLRHCKLLERLPNTIGNLKSLIELDIFQTGIKELPDSIGHLESLMELNISQTGIKELPDSIGHLESLIELNISQTGIKELPDSIGNLESLIELNISQTRFKELPDSIRKLKNLKVVKMRWIAISKIPDALWTIEKLEEIDACLTYDARVSHEPNVEIGNCICRNQSLRILRLYGLRINGVVPRLPKSLIILELSTLHMDTFPDLSNLTNLKELKLWFSRHYYGGQSDGPVEEYPMPRWIANLRKLETLTLSCDYLTHLPMDISSLLPRLQVLDICCRNLRCLPSLPSSLLTLYLDIVYVTALPTDISSLLPRLQILRLECRNLRCLPSLPSSLLSLSLDSKHMTALPSDLSSLLPRLQTLDIRCPNLRCLQSLPSSLSSLSLVGCNSFGSLGDLSNLKNLSDLTIIGSVISAIRGLDGSENLDLQLSELQQVWILPDLSNFNQLRSLNLYYCSNLVEIQGALPQFLERLVINTCGSLQKLPDLSSLKGLRSVYIMRCGKLNVEAISSLCSEKAIIFGGDRDESEV